MPKFWRNWLIAAIVCAAFIAWRVSGPVSPEAMGQVLIAILVPFAWAVIGGVRALVGRPKTH